MISEWTAAFFLVSGALFMLIAAIGMLRLKDVYLRIHAATKAPSLGMLLMVIGLIVYFGEWWPSIEGILIILFLFITIPIGSHMIARVAYLMKVSKSEKNHTDELTGPETIKKPTESGKQV